LSRIDERVEQYVRSLFHEAYGEAARILDKLRELKDKGAYSEGRYRALHGLLTAAQRGDRYSLFLRAKNEMSLEELEEVKKELEARTSSPVIDEFDKGFFEQWVAVIELLIRLKREAQGR